MRRAMRIEGASEALVEAWGQVMRKLVASDHGMTLRLACRWFGEQAYAVDDRYVERMRGAFGAGLEAIDFLRSRSARCSPSSASSTRSTATGPTSPASPILPTRAIASASARSSTRPSSRSTRPAAATAVVVAVGGGPARSPLAFRADHPFLFLLLDRSGLVLFMGRVADPTT